MRKPACAPRGHEATIIRQPARIVTGVRGIRWPTGTEAPPPGPFCEPRDGIWSSHIGPALALGVRIVGPALALGVRIVGPALALGVRTLASRWRLGFGRWPRDGVWSSDVGPARALGVRIAFVHSRARSADEFA
jgi:hypothetical protein